MMRTMPNDDLEKVLADLIHEYALMWDGEWGGGGNDWPDMLSERRGPHEDTAITRALDALGMTWDEFVAARGAYRIPGGWSHVAS